MNERKYLNEENYQRGKKKVMTIALIVLIIGLLIGGSLIFTGIKKQSDVNSKYSSESKTSINEQLAIEKQKLENKKSELTSKGITYDDFTEYDAGESYDLKIISNVLNPSFDNCRFDEYKNNSITSKYCSLKNELEDNTDFKKDFDSFDSIPFFMFGGFIIIATLMISGVIFMFGKRREITAFTTQQVMPVAKEGIDEMAPTIGNAVGEIAKGIKNGLSDDNEQK